jgi:hypothetical protein
MARKVIAATLREAARAIERTAQELDQPWAMDLGAQLRALAHHITSSNFGK